ncbi:PqiC family protein [Actimicrobium antarcticum]|uniref:PqiC family protein n=1 Tax=Actimicrobium antarcticum TaxID=1051899 RepID=A0ABP7STQ8_9BURK
MKTSVRVIVLTATALLCACASPPAEHFYTLDAVAHGSPPAPGNSALSIRLGPVNLPEMVDRPQLVLRSGPNEVRLMEARRWAESLRSAIPRVIGSNLKRQWQDVQVSSTLDGTTAPARYSVAIDILRFDSTLGEAVELEARWRIRRDGKSLQAGSMAWREPVQGAGYEDLAAAHDRALASLSRQLATSINAAERAP